MDITYYEDNVCCEDAEQINSGMLIDTYGGDYSYLETIYVCKRCQRVFYEYSGRFQGICEEDDANEKAEFLS